MENRVSIRYLLPKIGKPFPYKECLFLSAGNLTLLASASEVVTFSCTSRHFLCQVTRGAGGARLQFTPS